MDVKKIFLLSPCGEQYTIFRKYFPTSSIVSLQKDEWDLNFDYRESADLIFAGNVLMYSENPGLWIKNIRKNCKLLIIQDLIDRKRGINQELGPDEDKIRYSFKENISNFIDNYSLDYLKDDMIDFNTYSDIERKDSKHFICIMRGKENV